MAFYRWFPTKIRIEYWGSPQQRKMYNSSTTFTDKDRVFRGLLDYLSRSVFRSTLYSWTILHVLFFLKSGLWSKFSFCFFGMMADYWLISCNDARSLHTRGQNLITWGSYALTYHSLAEYAEVSSNSHKRFREYYTFHKSKKNIFILK